MVRLCLEYDDLGMTVRDSSRIFYIRGADTIHDIYWRMDSIWTQLVDLFRSQGGEDPFATVEVEAVEFNENFVPSLFSLCERVLQREILPRVEHTLPISVRCAIMRQRRYRSRNTP